MCIGHVFSSRQLPGSCTSACTCWLTARPSHTPCMQSCSQARRGTVALKHTLGIDSRALAKWKGGHHTAWECSTCDDATRLESVRRPYKRDSTASELVALNVLQSLTHPTQATCTTTYSMMMRHTHSGTHVPQQGRRRGTAGPGPGRSLKRPRARPPPLVLPILMHSCLFQVIEVGM